MERLNPLAEDPALACLRLPGHPVSRSFCLGQPQPPKWGPSGARWQAQLSSPWRCYNVPVAGKRWSEKTQRMTPRKRDRLTSHLRGKTRSSSPESLYDFWVTGIEEEDAIDDERGRKAEERGPRSPHGTKEPGQWRQEEGKKRDHEDEKRAGTERSE
ncbi:hypothetical protein NDU88_004342 [Pleurodeles waltl]|uniref:Uncharacterized protein n=1 Tax=Pleurodeles waltl TaxID=8319 RepID=A0AAV7V3A6_PLEWA|nr:hypothetical protein NDU88_004342 [Pleurodeles waltl]